MNVVHKIPLKIQFLLPKTQPKPQTIFDARFLRRLYCAGLVEKNDLLAVVGPAADQIDFGTNFIE